MSLEIVPDPEGSETPSQTSIDLLDLVGSESYGVKVDLIGGTHKMKHFLSPDQGHKQVTQLNPTPASIKSLLDTMKEPSVLCLRGCELLLRAGFPFEKFKSLTALEISGSTHLKTLPQNDISRMTQLQSLTLSRLPIEHLPHDLFSGLTTLRSFVLRACLNLHSLPHFPPLTSLQCLHLSHLLIETLPDGIFSGLGELRWLILRGCSKLRSIPSTEYLTKLEVLDLSHCSALQELNHTPLSHTCLMMLDLSYTSSLHTITLHPSFGLGLTHLIARDTNVKLYHSPNFLPSLKVVDLSGAQTLVDIDILFASYNLVNLDLSRTQIESVDFLSNMGELRNLILGECTRLVRLPAMKELTNLEVLDVSGCEALCDLPRDLDSLRNLKELNLSGCSSLRDLREGLFDHMACLEKLDLSKTNINPLPSFTNLTNLNTLNPDESSHLVLENYETDFFGVCSSGMGSLEEFHLVSTFRSESGFDRFKYEFTKLSHLISSIQEYITKTTDNVSQTFKKSFRNMQADFNYILESIDLLETSVNCTSSEALLLELVNVATRLSVTEFLVNPINLNILVRMVAKLKLLVPRPPPPKQVDVEDKRNKKNRKLQFMRPDEEEVSFGIGPAGTHELRSSYASLTDLQRNCLLYFVAFPYGLGIKERILVHLWYGEGFIDAALCADPTNSVKEAGQQVLKALKEKGFILYGEGTARFLSSIEYCFVMACAKAEDFFNFNVNGKLTPHINASPRACLLKSQDNCLPSSQLWLSYTNCFEELERLKAVRTLVFVNELTIDVKTEWFAHMQNLCVLHLGSLSSEDDDQIDIMDLKFLEELEHMKQLKLVSLEAFSPIVRLPDSFCKLTNLRVLNLRYCSNLEELPDGIGSLENLTHLDLTQCHLLSKLPKGLSSLSKLEVLKGFVINYEAGGRQHKKACTLKELLKLESLVKLNLVVNKDVFPNSHDLKVIMEMKSLSNLMITWTRDYNKGKEPEEVIRLSSWKQLKLTCWEPQTPPDSAEEEPLCKSNLRKLVLCCYPSETAPIWLHPGGLDKLERLYVVGGNLKTLHDQSTWSIVKTLRLKYLYNLDMDWAVLKGIFPSMSSFKRHECPGIRNLGSETDEWNIESQGVESPHQEIESEEMEMLKLIARSYGTRSNWT